MYPKKATFLSIIPIISYNIENNISVHLEKKITKPIAEILLEMANYLEALLLIDEKTVIDQQFIEELERKQ